MSAVMSDRSSLPAQLHFAGLYSPLFSVWGVVLPQRLNANCGIGLPDLNQHVALRASIFIQYPTAHNDAFSHWFPMVLPGQVERLWIACLEPKSRPCNFAERLRNADQTLSWRPRLRRYIWRVEVLWMGAICGITIAADGASLPADGFFHIGSYEAFVACARAVLCFKSRSVFNSSSDGSGFVVRLPETCTSQSVAA